MRLLLLAAGLSLFASPISAQEGAAERQERQGFWVSLGAGMGSRGLSCDFCTGGHRQSGLATSFRVGGTLSPQVTVGANLVGWIKALSPAEGGSYGVFTALMGTLQVYPITRSGFFFQGGGGFIVDVVNSETVVEGPGMILGVGFDIPAGKGFSLTPQINYLRTIGGGNEVTSLYQFGIAATWH
jgi:hypothetical protein